MTALYINQLLLLLLLLLLSRYHPRPTLPINTHLVSHAHKVSQCFINTLTVTSMTDPLRLSSQDA